jgi:hypothetical protein
MIKLYKCPYCKNYFKPSRSNQLYCNNQHAYSLRNHLRKIKDTERINKIKCQLANLKILTTLEISNFIYLSEEKLSFMGFDWNGATPLTNPLLKENPDSTSKWFEVFGFIIRRSNKVGGTHWIFSPAESKIFS